MYLPLRTGVLATISMAFVFMAEMRPSFSEMVPPPLAKSFAELDSMNPASRNRGRPKWAPILDQLAAESLRG